ncbi:DNA polymerase III subunit delta [Bifidobacterium simiarum]|uniref:DNA polymerase III subunit delta n=1 Tax=Bifidobacterium simiarum TaxID=2045441 RepID=UPI001BDBBCD6|nr:DNA polymerase III subunit delta [Bifidobacterium simiarum]MBT1165266.1 DNA polymerase III subunit delta [Bifidobacterium simiarum]
MAAASKASNKAGTSPVVIVYGGDEFLNRQGARERCRAACDARPDAELIGLDASSCDAYAFDEAVSPSLLSDVAVVSLTNLQNADDRLGDALIAYTKQAAKDPAHSSVVICRHEGGPKGKRVVDGMVRAGAERVQMPDLKKAEAKINFVYQRFDREHRRIDPAAAQQLVSVLGERTGELAAMCSQLCFDFDDDPITIDRVNQYLTANPQVTGFMVADRAVAGDAAGAIVAMRSAIEQGTDPIALIGALAMKMRTMAKASAVKMGRITKAEAKTNPWVLSNAERQLPGWTSQGMSHCIRMLAWADEQSKTNGGDAVYALERSIESIAAKGRR